MGDRPSGTGSPGTGDRVRAHEGAEAGAPPSAAGGYHVLRILLLPDSISGTFDNPDDLFPTIYRIDRIKSFIVLDEHFQVPYKDRFQEGEFRKRVQFMYGGKLERIRFKYTGPSIEAVLDRLPTSKIVEQDEEGWTLEAEVFGKGIEMWLRSQGEHITKINARREEERRSGIEQI